MAGTFPQ